MIPGKTVDVPMVVLLKRKSGRRFESYDRMLKDYKNAVVGTTTYGKGIVQTILPLQMVQPLGLPLPNVHARYRYSRKGIEPDVEVKMSDKQWKKPRQMRRRQIEKTD